MLVATFSVHPETFALEDTVEALPDLRIEAERVAAHSTEWVMPCLWVADTEFDAVTTALENDPTIVDIVETTVFDDEAFYHVEWTDDVERRVGAMVDKEGSILDAKLRDGRWQIRIRFASREQFDDFRNHFDEEGHSFQLLDLTDPDSPHQAFGNLSASQRDALVTAVEAGYFRVPRETSAEELAEILGVSHQAVSELIRRGTENLVTATLTAESG